MKKAIWGLVLWATAVATVAWAQEKYVRKPVLPNFFMPEQELSGWKKQEPKKVVVPVQNIPSPNMQNARQPAKISNNSLKKPEKISDNLPKDTGEPGVIGQPGFRNLKMRAEQPDLVPVSVPAPPKKEYTPEDGLGEGLINDPIYQQRMDVYEQDLLKISKTGKMPQNDQLKSDLDAMNSNLSFSVE